MVRLFIVMLALVHFVSPSYAIGSADMQFDENVATDLKSQVVNDFSFLESIQASKASPIHQTTFGTVSGANYLQWFNKRVLFFGVDTCGGSTAVACVDPAFKNKIWVTDNYIQISHPQIARLMTLYHEARHTEEENDNWPHAKCPSNFKPTSIWTGAKLNNEYACDDTAYGSYSSASVMLNNISKFCTNCSAKVKADAKLYSDDQVKRVIDNTAIQQLAVDFAF